MRNPEYFIAKRIVFRPEAGKRFTRPVIRIAMAGVTLGMAVMIVSIAIVKGFQSQITEKVSGFGADIQVSYYDSNESFESTPIEIAPKTIAQLYAIPGVRHVQSYATKAGILKTKEDIYGLVLKGIDKNFEWDFFGQRIKEGSTFIPSDSATGNEILLSSYMAKKMKLKTGDDLTMYFIQQPPRARKFKVVGVYETGLEEFDKLYAICDMRHILKLNDWDTKQASGLEIFLDDRKDLDEAAYAVYNTVGYDLNARTIREIYPQLFDWLDLQNINVIIIISLIILVAGMNMISALLIIILERTRMIGVLKAIGTTDRSIRKIFIYVALHLLGTGMIIGNALGLILCFLQYQFGLVKLDQESYYMSVVPIHFAWTDFLLLNAGTLVICTIMFVLPSIIITRISPLKAIRFN